MKCGGTSLTKSLGNWFSMVYDHYRDLNKINQYKKNRYDINKLNSETCLVGHFNYEGIYLFQRYPEILDDSNNIKAFTFIRNPLSFYVSLYYYSRHFGRTDNTLEEYIDSNQNLLAYYLPCDEDNYREVLDKYFFIGITEKMQESVDKLAKIIKKRKISVSSVNKSKKDSQISIITDDFIEKFKEKNELDYLIYDYCLDKFRHS